MNFSMSGQILPVDKFAKHGAIDGQQWCPITVAGEKTLIGHLCQLRPLLDGGRRIKERHIYAQRHQHANYFYFE